MGGFWTEKPPMFIYMLDYNKLNKVKTGETEEVSKCKFKSADELRANLVYMRKGS